jgi:hypothetical protein
MNFDDDLVARRVRGKCIAGQRNIDAVRHRSFGNEDEELLRPHLPIATMDEKQRRRPVRGFQEVDPVALLPAVMQVEMRRMPLAQRGRPLLSIGDDVAAVRNGKAVVQPAFELLAAHRAPIRRPRWRRHFRRPPCFIHALSLCRKMVYRDRSPAQSLLRGNGELK